MTTKSKVATLSIAATVMILATLVTVTGLTSWVFAQGPPRIVIDLLGSEEVAPVQTEATSVAEIISMEPDSIGYSVNTTNIEGATAGHIHMSKQGENGPVA